MDVAPSSSENTEPVLLGEATRVTENGNLRISIRCKAKGRFSTSWYRNGVLVQHPSMSQEQRTEGNNVYTLSLIIKDYRANDVATFVVKVANDVGSVREVVRVGANAVSPVDQTETMDVDEQQLNRRDAGASSSSGAEAEVRPRTSTVVKPEVVENYRPLAVTAAASTSRETRRSSPMIQPHVPAKKVATCSPSTLATTQQVAPQIATIGSSGEGADSNAEVLSVFECPVCLEYMLPPYLQCHSGHLVCGNCRPKLQCCPTCRGQTPNVRNLGLEKIANTVRFPCKFANSGCGLFFFHQDKVEHEETCEFRPYSCPCPGASCKWQGALTDVMDHLKKVHKSITTLQGEDIVFLATDINLPGAVDWVMMQSCFGFNFMLVLEKQDRDQGQQMFYAVVQLIGAKKEADNFMYRLELSTMRRRLAWEATPRSIHEGVAHAIQQSDCLAFDTSTAQLFAENGNLGINVTISMVSDPLSLSSSR